MVFKKKEKKIKKKVIKEIEEEEIPTKKVEDKKPQEEIKEKYNDDYTAIVDINLKYRNGDKVPRLIVEEWKSRGINTKLMVK